MKTRPYICIISLLILTLPFFSSGKTYVDDCRNSRSKSALYFSNGMFNDIEDASASTLELAKRTGYRFNAYGFAYNFSETPILQLVEVFHQRSDANHKFLWSYFSKLNGPKWFVDLMSKASREITREAYVRDDDIKKHVQKYKEYLKRKIGIVVVSHSQGNFYANSAYEYLKDYEKSDVSRIEVVGIASPDSYVAGLGSYRTLTSDRLIRTIPGALPPNVSNQNPGLVDHEFTKFYLNGDPSGNQILSLIDKAQNKATEVNYFFEPGYLHKSLENMNIWVKELSTGKIKKALSKTECLATSLFLKNSNWWGVDCTQRSLSTISKGAERCLEDEWSNPNQASFDCTLYGLPSQMLNSWGTSKSENSLFGTGKYPECKWGTKNLHNELTRETLQNALSFIENPKRK